jgi:hypothetical protein
MAMKLSNRLEVYVDSGVRFDAVEYVVEIFPSPIPEEISDLPMNTDTDLLWMSSHLGFDELYVPAREQITGYVRGHAMTFTRHEFMAWQLSRMNTQTLYYLITKTDTDILDLLDEEAEYEKDPSYDPSNWLHPHGISKDDLAKGFALVDRLRNEHSADFYDRLAIQVVDEHSGVMSWLETEVHDDLETVRHLYQSWQVPLMMVSDGAFETYIDPEESGCLMRDGYRLLRMHVRNYDEGEIDAEAYQP